MPCIAVAVALVSPPPDCAANVRAAVSGTGGPAATAAGLSGAPLVLEVPWDGTVVVGTTLEIRGTASRPIGRIHAEVVNGLAVLGAADMRVDSAGMFRMTMPLSVSGEIARARLTISSPGESRARVFIARDITVCPFCA